MGLSLGVSHEHFGRLTRTLWVLMFRTTYYAARCSIAEMPVIAAIPHGSVGFVDVSNGGSRNGFKNGQILTERCVSGESPENTIALVDN